MLNSTAIIYLFISLLIILGGTALIGFLCHTRRNLQSILITYFSLPIINIIGWFLIDFWYIYVDNYSTYFNPGIFSIVLKALCLWMLSFNKIGIKNLLGVINGFILCAYNLFEFYSATGTFASYNYVDGYLRYNGMLDYFYLHGEILNIIWVFIEIIFMAIFYYTLNVSKLVKICAYIPVIYLIITTIFHICIGQSYFEHTTLIIINILGILVRIPVIIALIVGMVKGKKQITVAQTQIS